MSTNISDNNKRLAKNTILLYIRMIFMMLISLFTSRVVLQTLGTTDFGIYNVVGGVVVFFSFLSNAMISSIQRFLNFELGRNDTKEATRVFSMSINCQLIIIGAIVLLGETLGLWFVNTYLNIPDERMVAANWVYQLSIFSTCVGVFYAPYNAAIIAYERMEIYAYVSILEALLKLSIVYCLIIGDFDKLILYAILLVIVQIIVASVYIIYCLRKFSICHYHYFKDSNLFKKILNFSGWSLFGSTASVASNQGVGIIQNMFFGVIINAAMGIANQVNGAIQGLVSNFSTAYRPQIVKLYAAGEEDAFISILHRTSKFTYFLMLVIAVPLIICCSEVLDIWLEEVPEYAVIFTQLIIIYSLTEAISTPLWMAVQATGNIKRYQIEISLIKIAAIPVIILAFNLGAPTEAALYILVIDNVFNHIYRLFYLRNNISFSIHSYTKAVMWPTFLVTILSIPIPVILHQILGGYLGLFTVIVVAVLITGLLIFYIGLNKVERFKVLDIIKNKLKNV